MAVLVILSREALDMIFACRNGALFWPFCLMSEHVSLQILEGLAALGMRTSLLLLRSFISAIRLFGKVGLV
jgi:hypothetical protein